MRSSSLFAATFIFALATGASSLAFAESTGQYVDDATITTKVKAALLADAPIKALKISVTTDHGVVQLTGTADTKAQESEAIKTANQVSGVISVKDSISVSNTQEQ